MRPPKISTKLNTAPAEGVHVHVRISTLLKRFNLNNYEQMETFESPSDKSFVEYDAAGKVVKSDSYDHEAQVISNEFKRPPY